MQTFLLLFRANYQLIAEVSASEMQQRNSDWMQWLNTMQERKQLAGGNHLDTEGRVVRANDVVENGTMKSEGNSVLGYLLIQAENYDAAVLIAKECPILAGEGNTVEVRALHSM